MKRRVFLSASASAAGLAVTRLAHAANDTAPRKYLAMSLVGDILNVVESQPVTGSLLDKNRHASITITDGAFDKAALLATDAALKHGDATTSVTLLAASSPALFSEQWKLFDGTRLTLPGELGASLQSSGATHLVMLTKHREEARLRIQGGHLGTGMLEGIGFYIDRRTQLRDVESLERGQGFLAPFVYFKVSLVELASSTEVAHEIVAASQTLSASRSKESFDPWDTLNPRQEVATLQGMMAQELARTVPLIVAVK